jgi:uncharacterized NAD(P)/FAD-binding protein YdhS
MGQMIASIRQHTVAVIGGGFTGSLFALKILRARPDWAVLLVEDRVHAGRGIAYGACEAQHLLNVPVSRMEVGLEPGFGAWLRSRPGLLGDALAESKGRLEDAFVPRHLFGDYMEQRLSDVLLSSDGQRLRRIRGRVVRIESAPRYIVLGDGSTHPIDSVVLATGNLPSRLPFPVPASSRIIHDPWAPDALAGIGPDSSVLLIGTGLTMVDTLLSLKARGHTGPVHAVSRHGLLPRAHRAGGHWPAFLEEALSPKEALHLFRVNIRQAEERGIAWQRVFDAARPVVASLWHGWTIGQRAQFLRHLRAIWDIHRHRMADRIAAVVNELLWNGKLTITAGRVLATDEHKDGITAVIRPRSEKALTVDVDAIVNCTGPDLDIRHSDHPLLGNIQRRGLIRSDPLGLGIETQDGAAVEVEGTVSDWLFVLGPPTRPAWWEITAVPEVTAQIDRLVDRLSATSIESFRPLPAIFLDIGAGI